MATTVVVRGSGGTLFEMDVPAGGTLLDTWNEKIASGELVIVTAPVKWVDGIDGAKHLVLDVPADPDETPAEPDEVEAEPAEPKRRARPPKSTEETTEVAPTEE